MSINFIVPNFWAAVDMGRDLPAQAREVAKRLTAGPTTNDSAARIRAAVEGQVLAQLRSAAEAGAEFLLMEADPVGGVRTGTFLMILPLETEDRTDPMDRLLAVASSTPDAVVLEANGLVALRTTTVDDVSTGIAQDVAAAQEEYDLDISYVPPRTGVRRVNIQYLLGDPDSAENWRIVVGAVTSRDDAESRELMDAIIGVCDSIIETMRLV